jgi:metal-responsive CopG/Arc/MetJ family transcriptional regulator
MPSVKTAISVPQKLARQADALARKLKMSRSRFFSIAASEFIRRHSAAELLEEINRAYSAPESEEDQNVRRSALHLHSKLVGGTW